MHFLKEEIGSLQHLQILLVGAGETIDLLLPYLQQSVMPPLRLVNRSFDKGNALAKTHGALSFSWAELPSLLGQVDIVITATGSPKPIITAKMVQDAMSSRAHHPLYLVDLAVPRDVDPMSVEVPDVSLYCIDDLTKVVAKHREGREHAASKARDLIQKASEAFMQELASSEHVSHTIRSYRKNIEELCQRELEKAYQQLALGADAEVVLNLFARALTNKLLHSPSVMLRQAGREGRLELLHFAKQLFAVSE